MKKKLTPPEIVDELSKGLKLSIAKISALAGYDRPQAFYDIKKGKTKRISEEMIDNITTAFPRVNPIWLMSGEGEMLKPLAGAEENPYLKGTNLNNENEEPLNSNDMEKDFLMKMLEGSRSQIEQFLSQQEKMLSQQDELISIIKNLTSRKSDEADSKKKPTIGDRSKEKGSIESPTESK